MAEGIKEIPSPPGLPLLGNINDINPEFPLGSFLNLAEKYGKLVSSPARRVTAPLPKLTCPQARYTS